MPARSSTIPIGAERVGHFILVTRRQRVLLDDDLATLYGVETRVLLQAVKRNLERFPPDFMFELSSAKWTALRSQSVTSTPGRGGRRSLVWCHAGMTVMPSGGFLVCAGDATQQGFAETATCELNAVG